MLKYLEEIKLKVINFIKMNIHIIGGMYMNVSKENIFDVKYTSVLENKKESWTSSIIKFFHRNKLISISIIVFFACVCMNLLLIYNFFRALQQI